MSEQRTKGPWEISFEAPRWIIQAEVGFGKRAVAYLMGDYVTCAPNAHLIAAAPDLLDALEKLRTATLDDRQDISSARSVAAAAIAKARGQ